MTIDLRMYALPGLLLIAQASWGELTPYTGSPPVVMLTDKERDRLEKDKAVYKKIEVDGASRGVTIFRVKASQDHIWHIIRDFESYPQWIKNLKTTEVYDTRNGLLAVRFVAEQFFSGKITWHAIHDYPEPDDDRQWGTWTLDASKASDFEGSVGFWRVVPVPDRDHENTVIYSADIKLKTGVPRFIENMVVNSGLKAATKWVKEEAEANTYAND